MIKYIVGDEVFESTQEVLDYIADEDDIDESGYDAELDELYDEVNICGYTYDASYALKEIDPTAYRCGLADWRSEKFSELCDDLLEQLENLEEGDEDYIGGFLVRAVNDDPDSEEDDDDGCEDENE